MSNEEIRQRIDENNAKIKQALDPTTFVLNHDVARLIKENIALKLQCTHKFVNGKCVYCDAEEKIQ